MRKVILFTSHVQDLFQQSNIVGRELPRYSKAVDVSQHDADAS